MIFYVTYVNYLRYVKVEITSYVGLDDVRLAQVSDAEQQVELAVARADDGAFAEHQRLRALLGPRQLGEDEPGHQRLRDDAEARLEHDQRDGVRTLRVHAPVAVADRLLRLDREQQRRREVVHLETSNRTISAPVETVARGDTGTIQHAYDKLYFRAPKS